MNDESFLQETNNGIWPHLYTSLHTFLNLHDSRFALKVSHFYLKVHPDLNVFRAHEKVTAPFKPVHICLMKSVDPVVCKLKIVVASLHFAPAMLENKLCTVPYDSFKFF